MGQAKAKLTSQQMEDLIKESKYSKAEIEIWYHLFHRDFPSGHVTLKKFQKLYEEMFTKGDASQYSEKVFSLFDRDKNGTIDFFEMIVGISRSSNRTLATRLKWAFDMYDEDGDGFLTLTEMKLMLEAIYKLLGEEKLQKTMPKRLTATEWAIEIFQQMDADKDDKISLQEFTDAAEQNPSLVILYQLGAK